MAVPAPEIPAEVDLALDEVVVDAVHLPWMTAERHREPEAQALLRRAVAERLGAAVPPTAAIALEKRAIDARGRRARLRLAVRLLLPRPLAERAEQRAGARAPRPASAPFARLVRAPSGPRPTVVGAGPAGLFAALVLAEAGWAPRVLERGEAVEARGRKVSRLYARGELDAESNVCFGEGGAGTYSDGKLYTRVNDPRVRVVLEQLAGFGAPADILVHNRPHVGTDRLVRLLRNLRARLVSLGCEFSFGSKVVGIARNGERIESLEIESGERLPTAAVVLASGHSARDVWHWLERAGLALEPRPFAVGLRIEHPQALIDAGRYGQRGRTPACLPPADYRLTYSHGDGRAAYSFCMCPGGVVVATPTAPGALCINGMSTAARQGRFANSAVVVTVGPEDFARAGHRGTFAGLAFQEAIERAAYAMGGGDFVAPAARVVDFLAGRTSAQLGDTSYRRGIVPAPLHALLPAAVTATLRAALARFDQQLPAFAGGAAQLIGVETRTAAPVRLPRSPDTGLAVGTNNLYPAGEGLGYGGGIVSAAIDGMRAAESLLRHHGGRAMA